MIPETSFWQTLTELASINSIIVDRPRGTAHPRYAELIYPFDYGYLENTSAGDGEGIDVWIGTMKKQILTGILCTFDRLKRDAEIKLLIGCTLKDVETIQGFNNTIQSLFIPNPMAEHDLST